LKQESILMRNYLSLIVLLIIMSCAGTKNQQLAQNVSKANPEIAVAIITIEGMACQTGCADAIENNLNEVEGIESSQVSFEKSEAVVEFIPAKTNSNEIQETITNTKVKDYNYTIKNITINPKLSE